VKTALTKAQALERHQDQKFCFLLCLRLLAFAPQQVEKKRRSGKTQAGEYLTHVVDPDAIYCAGV